MQEIKSRSEVVASDKWDLSKIYKSDKEFYQELDSIKEEMTKINNYKDNFLTSKENFKSLILLDNDISRRIYKLSVYASLKNSEDLTDNNNQELMGKADTLYQEYQELTSFMAPSILDASKEVILSYLEDDNLEDFRFTISSLLRYQNHHLTKEEEKIIAAFSNSLGTGSQVADYLMDADMRFGNIKDENKEEVELTESNYSLYLRSKDRRVRKDAFNRLLEVYGSYKNTLCATLASSVETSSVYARLTNFNSSLESALFANNIPVSLYSNLIKTVKNNLKPLYKYYDVKRKLLGLDSFHLYDSYVSTVSKIDKKYTFDEGRDLVIKALSVLGDEYIETLKTAFTDGWIDKYPNRGKANGAFSSGSYDTLPYVLLNYTNTYNDVSTLAHELGHSMHSYFSNTNNSFTNASYPIFLAEIASTVNELLLSYYMEENTTDIELKKAILNERLDLFKGTIYRQTMFSEFELFIHDLKDKKEVLTNEVLTEKYFNLNKEYFGDKVEVDELIKYEWLRIPHFYRGFYVYQYATGLSIASYIAKNILNKKEGFTEKYLNFLKAGGSNYPLEVLKLIDVDLTDSKVFEEALKMFSDTLDTFIDICN